MSDRHVAAMREEAESLMDPGEALVALFTTVRAAPGTPDPSRLRTMSTSGSPLRVAGRGLLLAAGESERIVGNAMGRMLHGKGVHGGGSSSAASLVRALQPHGAPLAVTSRRVALLHGQRSLGTAALSVVWDLPRDQIREVRAAARGVVQRGRVEIRFADGSWLAVVTVPAGDAQALATTLGSPT